MSSPSPSRDRWHEARQKPDLLHDALLELEARGISVDRPLDELEFDLFWRALDRRGAGQVIERGVRAGRVYPGGPRDAFLDLVQDTWLKFIDTLCGLSLDEIHEAYPDHGQFEGTLFTAARNRAIDHQRSSQRRTCRETPLILGIEEEPGAISETLLVVEDGRGAIGTTHREVEMSIDCRKCYRKLQTYASESTSAQGRQTLPRLLRLIEMDGEGIIQNGCLPDTDNICRELGFPSASTVSQARRRYRELAQECFEWYEEE